MAFGSLKGTLTGTANSITNPFAATGSVSIAVGDLVYAVICEQTAITSTGCSDNLGNTYSAVSAGTTPGGNPTGHVWYSRVTTAGTLTAVSFAATASTNNVIAIAAVIEGPFATSPLDANPSDVINDLSSPYPCSSTGTLAQADEVVMCWRAHNALPTFTATSPNLLALQNSATIQTLVVGYQTVSATTSVTPSFTATGAPTNTVGGTTSFKKAANSYLLGVDAGSYAETGSDVALEFGFEIVPDAGTYAQVGTDVLLESGFEIVLDSESYTWTGTDLELAVTARRMPLDAGAYTQTESQLDFSIGINVSVDTGAYNTTLSLVDFLIGRTVPLESGIYFTTPSEIDLGFPLSRPPSRIATVIAQSRIGVVTAQSRIVIIPASSRVGTLE